jgi:hypothetical protein
MTSCLSGKESKQQISGFMRYDYPEMDPPVWRKYITIKQEAGRVKTGELPIDFSGPLEKSYESINKDYLVSSNCKKVGGAS